MSRGPLIFLFLFYKLYSSNEYLFNSQKKRVCCSFFVGFSITIRPLTAMGEDFKSRNRQLDAEHAPNTKGSLALTSLVPLKNSPRSFKYNKSIQS